MRNLVAKVRGWWGGAAAAPLPFEVPCACGHVLRGSRQARSQVLPCGHCRRRVFVLARSPLPPPLPRGASISGLRGSGRPELMEQARALLAQPPKPAGPKPPARRTWGWPLLAAGLTLAAVVVAIGLLIGLLQPRQPEPGTAPSVVNVPALIDEGDRALAAGNLKQALEKFNRARTELESHPDLVPPAQARHFRQQHAQAALLKNLLDVSLEDLLQKASTNQDEEVWKEEFAERYKGKGVVFDAEVRRERDGFQLDYAVRAGTEPARIDLSDLRFLAALPVNRSPRLLFGARLGSVAREPGAGGAAWVVRFEPDSGVLLTEPGVVKAAVPPPIDDELLDLLDRQAGWAAHLP
jgi:hypothetical protein